MCSISGIIQAESGGLHRAQLQRSAELMNAALRHRGPDDNGTIELNDADRNCIGYLGNTRLAIIDVSVAGHQPMHDPETGNWITYNGETYNFRQLRREIGNEFGPWHSNTDTEVVLRAYRKWGTAAFGRLWGMFALAIWDSATQQLILARDQFGIKPLYYSTDSAQRLLFASEVRALLASELLTRKLSVPAVRSYLEFGSVQAPHTIVDNVRSLMPGEVLSVSRNESSSLTVEVSRYQTSSGETDRPQSRDHAKAKLRTILEESVQQHLVSDVPVGVFLSGGMDSSAIVSLMSRVSAEAPKTFSVVFSEQQFDEASHSRLVAEKFKTDHCEVKLTESSLLDSLPATISALDQPSMDGVNTYVVSQAVKKAGITVALSGLGGDELFGGYPSFRRALKVQSTSGVAKGILKAIAPIGRMAGNGTTQRNKFWQFAMSDGSTESVCRITRQLFAPETIDRFSKSLGRGHGMPPRQLNGDTFNAMSKLELDGYMANTLLRDTDSMSMAHSLEVRVPLVDSEVAAFVLSLPGEWKLGSNGATTPKPLLADVLSDLLPADSLTRKKMGFTLPFEKWMVGELRGEVSTAFSNTELWARAGIDNDTALSVWKRFLKGPRAVGWSRPWALFVLVKWCEINQVAVS